MSGEQVVAGQKSGRVALIFRQKIGALQSRPDAKANREVGLG